MNTKDQQPLENVDEINLAGTHLLDLINDILDVSKIESDEVKLSLGDVVLSQVMLESLQLISPLAQKRSIKIITKIHGKRVTSYNSVPDVIFRADAVHFKQVLLNLLSNAVKYNHDNGTITINCEESFDKQLLRISITDTGKGLSQQQQAKLFTPFERLDAEITNIEGTGIGLLITKKLIKEMNGKIGIDSIVNEGSTFWIELPYNKEQMNTQG
ncbi:MAG: HAMP domain-containing histidine kinase [Proteobacteria bacterium]|nr:HAMP domain-containing histidine kinase [Pseudomonadota bacterium]